MKKLKHPNIINLVEVIEEKQSDELYIIMEYVPNGTLASRIEKGLNEIQIWKYFWDLI